jgi:hypothetical protein
VGHHQHQAAGFDQLSGGGTLRAHCQPVPGTISFFKLSQAADLAAVGLLTLTNCLAVAQGDIRFIDASSHFLCILWVTTRLLAVTSCLAAAHGGLAAGADYPHLPSSTPMMGPIPPNTKLLPTLTTRHSTHATSYTSATPPWGTHPWIGWAAPSSCCHEQSPAPNLGQWARSVGYCWVRCGGLVNKFVDK